MELTLFLGSTTTKTTTTTTKTTTKEQIIELIEADPTVSISEIAEKIGLSKDGVYYHIKQMLGKTINHIGPTNGGHWEIIKK